MCGFFVYLCGGFGDVVCRKKWGVDVRAYWLVSGG